MVHVACAHIAKPPRARSVQVGVPRPSPAAPPASHCAEHPARVSRRVEFRRPLRGTSSRVRCPGGSPVLLSPAEKTHETAHRATAHGPSRCRKNAGRADNSVDNRPSVGNISSTTVVRHNSTPAVPGILAPRGYEPRRRSGPIPPPSRHPLWGRCRRCCKPPTSPVPSPRPFRVGRCSVPGNVVHLTTRQAPGARGAGGSSRVRARGGGADRPPRARRRESSTPEE
jgi:hypothetical protein